MSSKALVSNCILCDGTKLTHFPYPKKGSENASISFDKVAVCANCGFGRAEPVLSQQDLDHFYAEGLYWEKPVNAPVIYGHNKVQAKIRVKACLKFLESKKDITVLDIGAGHGHILEWLAHYFGSEKVRYDFVEPDPNLAKCIANSKQVSKINRLEVANIKPNTYDVIFLNHVIEHVQNPIDFLEPVLKGLKPDGICYVETPCRDDLFKESVFPHTLFFTSESFVRLAKKLNVQVFDVRKFGSNISIDPKESRKIYNKILFKLFNISAQKNIWPLVYFLDSQIFQYSKPADEIWVSAIFKRL